MALPCKFKHSSKQNCSYNQPKHNSVNNGLTKKWLKLGSKETLGCHLCYDRHTTLQPLYKMESCPDKKLVILLKRSITEAKL